MSDYIYRGEMQLARWSETSTGGAQITCWLPDGESLEAFKTLTARKNGKAGQILAVVIKLVDEDAVEEVPPEPSMECGEPEPMKGGELAKLAGQWENYPPFLDYLRIWIRTEESPKAYICRRCNIESRRQLDHIQYAADYFHEFIRLPFQEWCRKTGRS